MYRVALVDPQTSTREALCGLLRGMGDVRLVVVRADYELFRPPRAAGWPAAVIVVLDADWDAGLRLIAGLSAQPPAAGILAVCARTDGASVCRALESGATEYFSQPL